MESNCIRAIRGFNDVLPEESHIWQYMQNIFTKCLSSYGYSEIKLPIIKSTNLFKRTIGEVTDIVEKEMYTFTDLNGDSLSLRPEGTAGCVRACLEHGLVYNNPQKLWYQGPMFRHERPQKGRYRQFYHLGVEVFGISGFNIEIELILLCKRLWLELGISDEVILEVNTIGNLEERNNYRQSLIDYFTPLMHLLDEDSKNRVSRSPLRILDSKNPELADIIDKAPKLSDYLQEESKSHFTNLCQGLDSLGVSYFINPHLVRGLDYYGQTVFEWKTTRLGAQATVCAGGRYDKLVEQLGGKNTPAVGFALGIERIILLMKELNVSPKISSPDIFIITDSQASLLVGINIAEQLRVKFDLVVIVNLGMESFKSQFKKADKSQAKLGIIIGESEILDKTVSIKELQIKSEQLLVKQADIEDYVGNYFSGEKLCQSI